MNTINWKKTLNFDGYCSQPDYDHIKVPTSLTNQEAFILTGTLLITKTGVSSLRYRFSETIYGEEDPAVFVREFDFNHILYSFVTEGLIVIKGDYAMLTEEGKRYLSDNSSIGIEVFTKKRAETRARLTEKIYVTNVRKKYQIEDHQGK